MAMAIREGSIHIQIQIEMEMRIMAAMTTCTTAGMLQQTWVVWEIKETLTINSNINTKTKIQATATVLTVIKQAEKITKQNRTERVWCFAFSMN